MRPIVKNRAHQVRCPKCGDDQVTLDMWGRVDPETGRYVRRLLGFRVDTLLLSLVAFGPGILYMAFYLVALPGYSVWRVVTWHRYRARRYEYVCEACGFAWAWTEGEPEPGPGPALA